MLTSPDSKVLVVPIINQKITFSSTFSKNSRWKSQNFQRFQESNQRWLKNRTKHSLIQKLFASHEKLRKTHLKSWRWKESLCNFSVTFSKKLKTNKLLINDSISDNFVVKWILKRSGFVKRGLMFNGSRVLINSSCSDSSNFLSCQKKIILNSTSLYSSSEW